MNFIIPPALKQPVHITNTCISIVLKSSSSEIRRITRASIIYLLIEHSLNLKSLFTFAMHLVLAIHNVGTPSPREGGARDLRHLETMDDCNNSKKSVIKKCYVIHHKQRQKE